MKKILFPTLVFVTLLTIFDFIEYGKITSTNFIILLVEGLLFGLIVYLILLFKSKKGKKGSSYEKNFKY